MLRSNRADVAEANAPAMRIDTNRGVDMIAMFSFLSCYNLLSFVAVFCRCLLSPFLNHCRFL